MENWMKITFEKNMRLWEALELFEDFIKEQSGDYFLLKGNMTINVSLKNDIGRINPDNERQFYFDKKQFELLQNDKRRKEDIRLEDEWDLYTGNHRFSELVKAINADHKYLAEAQEKRRSLEKIEKRKKELQKHERQLNNEKSRLEFLKPFIEMVNEKRVKSEYVEYNYNKWVKRMIFEFDKVYVFEYHPEVEGECQLRLEEESFF